MKLFDFLTLIRGRLSFTYNHKNDVWSVWVENLKDRNNKFPIVANENSTDLAIEAFRAKISKNTLVYSGIQLEIPELSL